MKYNIALLPQTKSQPVTELAHEFASIADRYILGENSLPHLTLSHFFAKESDLQHIWDETCRAIQQHTIELTFSEFSFCTFNQEIYWISLLPNKFTELKKLHLIVANIIKHPISRAYDRYDPHMTLINTKNKSADKLVQKVEKNFSPIIDEFVIALGVTDEAGQFVDLVFQHGITK